MNFPGLPDRIVEIAKSYIGQTELPANSGFTDPAFQTLMEGIGWLKSESWCAFFAKMVWMQAFREIDPVGAALVLKYANGSSLQTYFNFQKCPEFHVQYHPTPGGLIIFREGSGSSGHEGIDTAVRATDFDFISGNTSVAGSREGTTVLEKAHGLNLPYSTGLNYLGCVVPNRIA